jgi:hypothetical protein
MLQMLGRYKEMAPERQAQVRQLFRKMVDAPPEVRQRYLDNLERWRHMTPAQRDQARDLWRQKGKKP